MDVIKQLIEERGLEVAFVATSTKKKTKAHIKGIVCGNYKVDNAVSVEATDAVCSSCVTKLKKMPVVVVSDKVDGTPPLNVLMNDYTVKHLAKVGNKGKVEGKGKMAKTLTSNKDKDVDIGDDVEDGVGIDDVEDEDVEDGSDDEVSDDEVSDDGDVSAGEDDVIDEGEDDIEDDIDEVGDDVVDIGGDAESDCGNGGMDNDEKDAYKDHVKTSKTKRSGESSEFTKLKNALKARCKKKNETRPAYRYNVVVAKIPETAAERKIPFFEREEVYLEGVDDKWLYKMEEKNVKIGGVIKKELKPVNYRRLKEIESIRQNYLYDGDMEC